MYGLSEEENRSLIDEMTGAYLEEIGKRGRLEREIEGAERLELNKPLALYYCAKKVTA